MVVSISRQKGGETKREVDIKTGTETCRQKKGRKKDRLTELNQTERKEEKIREKD